MEELRKYAEVRQMRMLRDEVKDLIEQGVTSIKEALHILYAVE